MAPKPTLQRYFSILLITGLVACGRQADHVTPIPGLTAVDRTSESAAFQTAAVQTVKAMPTFGPAATNTQAQSFLPTVSFFTSTPGPIPTSAPTKTPSSATPAPTRTPLHFVPLDGLRVAYIIDGNLYVQDSGKQAIKLTHSGQDRMPAFSDDGRKIIFYRGPMSEKNQVYVIDVDGTGEHKLATPDLLARLGLGYDESTELYSLAFIPGTHQLLFNTHQRGTSNPGLKLGWQYSHSGDLLIVDADTAEIKRLLVPGQVGDFLISPNGKWVAAQTPDHIEVLDIQGRIVHRNLVVYPADEAHIRVPMYWTKDSNELIVLPSDSPLLVGGIPIVRTVWRYSLDGKPGKKIPLYPPPLYDEYAVSPDGNWIAYGFNPHSLTIDLGDAPFGVYLGNLRDGTSQLLDTEKLQSDSYLSFNWSPDSRHFIYRDSEVQRYGQTYIGNIQGEITPLGAGMLPDWIDNYRYLYGGGILGEVSKKERVKVVELPPGPGMDYSEPPAFVFLGH